MTFTQKEGKEALRCRSVQQGFFVSGLEEIVVVLTSVASERATETTNPQANLRELAERGLRRNPYLALKNISCDVLDGVLVLRGCLPSYYLKQIAQEVVAHLEGVARIDNRIEVMAGTFRSTRD